LKIRIVYKQIPNQKLLKHNADCIILLARKKLRLKKNLIFYEYLRYHGFSDSVSLVVSIFDFNLNEIKSLSKAG